MSHRFNVNLAKWFYIRFDRLDSEVVESNAHAWINEFKRLSKANFIKNNFKQVEFLNFVLDCLNHFKIFMPMIKSLRTKGFALRHWKMLNEKFKMNIDSNHLTLMKLISYGLYKEEKMSFIKETTDIAIKEYGVQTSLEHLEKEVKEL